MKKRTKNEEQKIERKRAARLLKKRRIVGMESTL